MHAFIIVILILAILLVIFTLQNSFEITITAFFWKIPDAPLVLVLLVCVLLGYIIAAVYFYPRLWQLKKERRHLSKSNEKLQKEVVKEKNSRLQQENNPEGIELDVDDTEEENPETGFFRE